MNSADTFPRARRGGLVLQEVDNETLVFDKQTRQAHCLNQLAGLVWRHCDGKTSREDLAEILRQQLHIAADLQLVELALEELAQAGLLENIIPVASQQTQFTRREMARRLGVGAAAALVLAPLVTSMARATGVVGGGSPKPTTTIFT